MGCLTLSHQRRGGSEMLSSLQQQGAPRWSLCVFTLLNDNSQVALQKSLSLFHESLGIWNPEKKKKKKNMRPWEKILSADLSVLLSSVVWLMQWSGPEIDDLLSFQLWGSAMLRKLGEVLNLAGSGGWRKRTPLRDNRRQSLLRSVHIHKALGNPVRTKEVLVNISHFQTPKDWDLWAKVPWVLFYRQYLWRYWLSMK